MKQKRRDGTEIAACGQDKLLAALYGHAWGRMLLKPLVQPWISRAAGWLLSTRLSCVLIEPFIRKNNIDMSQFAEEKYHSYNAFFSRRIKPGARVVDMDPAHFVSPCDSKLTVLKITDDMRFALKHTEYSVASLLCNDALAQRYTGGWALVFRLTVDDYHRYCYAADGEKGENVFIPGRLHTVNPIANDYFPIYKENSREYSVLHSDDFGDIVMMEVGALLVGRIVNLHGEKRVQRGEEKGYFQFGGSTIVLLVQKDQLLPDADIIENSREGAETVVRMGEKIGCKG